MLLLQLPWWQKFSSMQEIKFKIKQAESANVEIIPCADGVEIVVRYGESQNNYGSNEKKPFKFHNKQEKSNAEIIKDFCSEKKNEKGVNLKELKSFYDFYTERADDWKGKMDTNKLWERWLETAK